jgi:hypothetical protein
LSERGSGERGLGRLREKKLAKGSEKHSMCDRRRKKRVFSFFWLRLGGEGEEEGGFSILLASIGRRVRDRGWGVVSSEIKNQQNSGNEISEKIINTLERKENVVG